MIMNTQDIGMFLNADSTCRQIFQDVISDMLPSNPGLLVCNTDS